MTERYVLALVCWAGCGDRADTALPDAAPDTPYAPQATIVHSMVSMPTTAMVASIAIPPTGAGNLLVAGIAITGAQGYAVETITFPGERYFTRDLGVSLNGCNRIIETWSAWDLSPGLDSFEIQLAAPVTFSVYVLEVAGLSRFPLSRTGGVGVPGGEIMAPTPTLPAPAGALIVSMITTCDTVTGLASGSEFTALPIQHGSDLAYLVAASEGDYGAAWSYTGPVWQTIVTYR
jgi:hypothetical protein